MRTLIHIHTHSYTFIHLHTPSYTFIHTFAHLHTPSYTFIHLHTPSYTFIHNFAHLHTPSYTILHIFIHLHSPSYTLLPHHRHTLLSTFFSRHALGASKGAQYILHGTQNYDSVKDATVDCDLRVGFTRVSAQEK